MKFCLDIEPYPDDDPEPYPDDSIEDEIESYSDDIRWNKMKMKLNIRWKF